MNGERNLPDGPISDVSVEAWRRDLIIQHAACISRLDGMSLPPSEYSMNAMDRPIIRPGEAFRDNAGPERPDYSL